MASLKRFFHAEKTSSETHDNRDPQTRSLAGDCHSSALPRAATSQPLNSGSRISQPTQGLHTRPVSSYSQPPSSHPSSPIPDKTPRHVDLLDALFSSHRYHIQCPTSLSPITPYNEDIAERNMAFFLKGTFFHKVAYPRPTSYQGDATLRNTFRGSSRSLARSASPRSKSAHGSPLRSNPRSERDATKGRTRLRAREERVATTTSEKLTATASSARDERPNSSRKISFERSSLRSQRSAPNLVAERPKTSDTEPPTPGNGYLGVPPAYKQGRRWSNTPLPDSPTIPLSISHEQGLEENGSTKNTSGVISNSKDQEGSNSSRNQSKKNVRDLSINTKLAARGKPNTKATHRVIQPPTPNTAGSTRPLSIAEVMNSPLPVATPTAVSPLPPSTEKVAEIMDMFRQAYTSEPVVTPHPTFETLQDAIVREINSHDAFKRLTFPDTECSLSPSPSQESFDKGLSVPLYPDTVPERGPSAKEGQLLKLIRKSSFRKHKRNSEQRRSISTSVPSTAIPQAPGGISRRRHTDAPLPSDKVLGEAEASEEAIEEPEMPMTFMDLLLRTEEATSGMISKKTSPLHGNTSQPTSAQSLSCEQANRFKPTPSILYMRAHGSDSTQGSRSSFSDDENDEEIIELPSLEPPEVRIHGVDYEPGAATSASNPSIKSPYRIMSWPRKPSNNTLNVN
ncbi:uncharacterized protein BO97DRAFT_412222 [Aspergillus homomorphus CBS 101889]|uniref:Uncharacterized protein n=1 Tax=Aspergillus homomorphus (strain CBS 101889) TaxID=1450537 RepID=A0A395I593_ASPHC|nr:hypothetical protein BO97DRAFT_412222 [Aspergillus homomorphus CBS 101889]RAL14936.1 hypothetical protein BO97DRAFT_412222 [Aspergillus homomorphus CBS 101889]